MARKRRKNCSNPRRSRRKKMLARRWRRYTKRRRSGIVEIRGWRRGKRWSALQRRMERPLKRRQRARARRMSQRKNPGISTVKQFKDALKNGPYAWPGGYPVFFITSDGAALSFDAAKKEKKRIIDSIKENSSDGWRVSGVDINWEDPNLYCDHTNKRIESAYAD